MTMKIPSRSTLLTASMAAVVWLFAGLGLEYALFGEEFGVSRRSSFVDANPPQPVPSAQSLLPAVSPPALSAPPAAKVGSLASAPATASPNTGSAAAGVPPSNVVRLIAFESSGQSFGSGAYVGNYGEYGLVLSNWHVVCEADGLVHVHFANGFSSYGAVLHSDQKWDLALIAVSRPPQSVPVLAIARALPKLGEPLWIAGYGPGEFRSAGGRCVRYLAPEIPSDGSAPLSEIIEVSVSARQGDSGGPILNANGELAGVLFGSDMVRNTAGSGCERVMRFLGQARGTLNSLPSRPEEHFARIERGKPKHGLLTSRNAVVTSPVTSPASTQPKMASPSYQPPLLRRGGDVAGSATSFGVRSDSRRYVQSAQQQ